MAATFKLPIHLFCFVIGMCALSCGSMDSRYIDYGAQAVAEDQTGLTDEEAAQEFALNMAPLLDDHCISCHSNTSIGGKKLVGDDGKDRSALLSYTGCNASKLHQKIANPSHGGGPQGENLPEATIASWLSLEPRCNSNGGTSGEDGDGSDGGSTTGGEDSGSDDSGDGDGGDGTGDDDGSDDAGGEDGPEPTPSPTPTPSPSPSGEELALQAFMVNIQPAVERSCFGCHQATPIAGMTLSNDPADNRAVFHNNTDCDVNALFNKISVGPHGGGNQSRNLSRTQIQTWVAAEPDCQ